MRTSKTVKDVARRIEHEVGLPRTLSVRIANKLNRLAKSVGWATHVEGGSPRIVVSGRDAVAGRFTVRTRLGARRTRKALKKRR